MLASLGTGYIVTHFTYAPVFLLAGLMHPLSAVLTYVLLPDRFFAVAELSLMPANLFHDVIPAVAIDLRPSKATQVRSLRADLWENVVYLLSDERREAAFEALRSAWA